MGTSKNLDSDLISSLIGLQETIEILIEHMDKGAISNLAFKLLNLDIEDYYVTPGVATSEVVKING